MIEIIDKYGKNSSEVSTLVVVDKNGDIKLKGGGGTSTGYIRRNSMYTNINYCGFAPIGSLESSAVWTVTKITVATDGSVVTQLFNNVTWTSVPI
jgi:hypothetical protein